MPDATSAYSLSPAAMRTAPSTPMILWYSDRPPSNPHSPSATPASIAKPTKNARWKTNCKMPAKSNACCCPKKTRCSPGFASAAPTSRHASSAAIITTISNLMKTASASPLPMSRARAFLPGCSWPCVAAPCARSRAKNHRPPKRSPSLTANSSPTSARTCSSAWPTAF